MFDEAKANRAIKFIRALKHTQGEWANQPFNLLEWEETIIRDLFGTVNEDGRRQYREAYISTARRNGKTELAAAIALYCLFADGEMGAEIYCNAGDRDQASKVYDAARTMVEYSETLSKYSKPIKSMKRIVYPKKNSYLRVLSHEAHTKHGFNVHVAINDEIHIWPNRLLYDVMKTGTGSRSQPLIINITTSGIGRESFSHDLYNYAKRILNKPDDDPTFYVAIHELDPEDDWKDENNWYKANPGLGTNIKLEDMRQSFRRAMNEPSFENTFKQLNLNMWVSSTIRWIQAATWDACGGIINPDSLNGRICYGGLDLASTRDLAAVVLVFPPSIDGESYILLPFFFIPGDNIEERVRKDRVKYDVWLRKGYVIATPGNVIDYAFIKKLILDLSLKYNLQEIGYDPHNAVQIVTELISEGLKLLPIRQGPLSMSPPMKGMERLLLQGKINHGNNPVLSWMADNVALRQDAHNNYGPDKEKSREKIDGIVAAIMAFDRALRNSDSGSIYDKGGIFFLDEQNIEKEVANEAVV